MRLLHITHQYIPAIGGSERYMADLSEELVRRGHQVDVFTSRSISVQTWRSELPVREVINGVNINRHASIKRYRWTWHLLRIANQQYQKSRKKIFEPLIGFGNGPIMPGLILNMILNAKRYDLVHIQTLPYAHFVYAYYFARFASLPIVVTPHIHVEQEDAFDLEMFNHVMRQVDTVVAVSEREIEYLLRRGVDRNKISVVGNGIKLEDYPQQDTSYCKTKLNLPENSFVMLFLGRKVAYKGLESVIKAFSLLQSQHENLYLVTAGPDSNFSKEMRDKYGGLPRWIDFPLVSDTEKLTLLNAADVLLLPSIGEAFGIVFLEAWAVGKPVIGARAGAIPWVIDDERDGFLVSPDCEEDIANKVEKLIQLPELAKSMGRCGQRKVRQRYTVQQIANIIETKYVDILAKYSSQTITGSET